MLRSDFNKLLSIASRDFSNQYFFQTPYTDKGYYFSFPKLRNSNTTGISMSFKYESFNQGMFLDIFPLDNCHFEDCECRYDKIKKLNIDNSNYMRRKSDDDNDKIRFSQHSGRNPFEVVKEINQIQTMYEKEESCNYVNNSALSVYPCKNLIFKKEFFSDSILKNFEGFDFPVPVGWNEILEINYGDYLKMPPKEERGKWHDKLIINPDISYKEYDVKKIKNKKNINLFNRDTQYWNQFYTNNPPSSMKESLFAQFVSKYIKNDKNIVDIGCGNGRDSFYFNQLGLNVYGIDASDSAIKELNKKAKTNMKFFCGNFINDENIYNSEMKMDYYYSRFTIHAVDADGEKELIKNVYKSLWVGGMFFIEVRSIHDEKYGKGELVARNAYLLDDHYRRFIDINELLVELIQTGFSIKYAEEEKGFSPYKNEDSPIIRIIAIKEK